MIIAAAILIGVIAAAFGFVAIEKKKSQGPLTYPLWRGNLFKPWAIFLLISLVLAGAVNLPRFVGLALHGFPTQGIITKVSAHEHCRVTYAYTVDGTQYSDSDSHCDLKAGDKPTVYYEAQNPQNTTLYPPVYALKNEVIATGLICLCLSTFLVLWFSMTYVIGRPKKQEPESNG